MQESEDGEMDIPADLATLKLLAAAEEESLRCSEFEEKKQWKCAGEQREANHKRLRSLKNV